MGQKLEQLTARSCRPKSPSGKFWFLISGWAEAAQHEADGGSGLAGVTLIVAGQPTTTADPGQRSLHTPLRNLLIGVGSRRSAQGLSRKFLMSHRRPTLERGHEVGSSALSVQVIPQLATKLLALLQSLVAVT